MSKLHVGYFVTADTDDGTRQGILVQSGKGGLLLGESGVFYTGARNEILVLNPPEDFVRKRRILVNKMVQLAVEEIRTGTSTLDQKEVVSNAIIYGRTFRITEQEVTRCLNCPLKTYLNLK